MLIWKVVEHSDVERFTAEGWELDQVLTRHMIDKVYLRTPVGVPSNSGSGWVEERQREEAHVVAAPLFLLKKDSEVISREKQLAERLAEATKRATEAEASAKIIDSQSRQVAHEILDVREELRDTKERLLTSETNRRQLERDIGKIREAIGMKEIVE